MKAWPSEPTELLKWEMDRYGDDVAELLAPGERLLGIVDPDVSGNPKPPRRLLPKRSLIDRVVAVQTWQLLDPIMNTITKASAGDMLGGGWESLAGQLVVAVVGAHQQGVLQTGRLFLAFTDRRQLLVAGRPVRYKPSHLLLEYPRGELRPRTGWVPDSRRARIDVEFSDGSWVGFDTRGPEGAVLTQRLLAS
jgi:hypothetical protein